MLKTSKRLSALLLAGTMMLSLAACGEKGLTTEDATKCVQVELDTTYKGDFTGFLDFYDNVTKADAQAQYNDNVEWESENFLTSLGPEALDGSGDAVPPSEMQLHRAKELFQDIYAKSDYSITSCTKQDDGTFAVKVTIKPINVIHLFNDNFDAGFEEFFAKYEAVDTESMSDEEFDSWYVNNFASEFYDTLLDVLEAQMADMDYLDAKDIVIQVQQSEDQSLFISDDDWINLDNMIIDYNI